MHLLGLRSRSVYGWIPHNAGFGFLEFPATVVGQNHFFETGFELPSSWSIFPLAME
jgi:hypothetical protein